MSGILFVAERIPDEIIQEICSSRQKLREFIEHQNKKYNKTNKTDNNTTTQSRKRKFNDLSPASKFKQTSIMDFLSKNKKFKANVEGDKSPTPEFTSVNSATSDIHDNTDVESNCSSVITNIHQLHELWEDDRIQRRRLVKSRMSTNSPLSVKTSKDTYGEEYAVQRIERLDEIDCVPHFLVKWKGYPASSNTWEPLNNLDDCDLLPPFLHRKLNFFLPKISLITEEMLKNKEIMLEPAEAFKRLKKFDVLELQSNLILLALLQTNDMQLANAYNTIFTKTKKNIALLPFYVERMLQLKQLEEWEKKINDIDKSSNLTVENLIDFECPPLNFTYTNDVEPGKGVTIPDDPPIGCDCTNGCSSKSKCCNDNSGSSFAYTSNKRIRVPPGTPVFECNKRCTCGSECMNRVVQQGRKHSLCIYKTSNNCGWGVRTLRTIYEGQFICEYVGEIINHEEAEKRGELYDAEGRTYLFDLDMNSKDNPYTIDAKYYGNVSHFINHSCDPNCGVWAVWINCLDLDLPKICLFALRRIEAGEELNFDYINENENSSDKKSPLKLTENSENKLSMECRCGTEKCRKILF